jgi:hybrid polyketide synthase / nonribosomal peptide synthetase ACE1
MYSCLVLTTFTISFGFGGANAHAILEAYTSPRESVAESYDSIVFTPFVFSAASQPSLISYLGCFCAYLRQTDIATVDVRDLAYTLHSRRSHLQISTSITASSLNELQVRLEEKLEYLRISEKQELGTRSLLQSPGTGKPLVIGVFTGQGAQWARMGAEMVEKSITARCLIESLDLRLSRLPTESRPSWSLLEELLKDSSCSRVDQSEFSQPLCTAVQILQVDMLHAAGIQISAVVGHSSGEIGAAYAAGVITAEDAICIAYYRGLYSRLAEGPKGEKGAMMAVESTVEDMQELCESRHFQGRVGIAAINSPSSITVTGDIDAVEGLQVILQDENKFARILRVDKAYHSHHMLACSTKYLESLSALNIKVRPGGKCSWFSSVQQGKEVSSLIESLGAKYWNENMVNPVFFMQALRSAWASNGPFDLAIELGPHPALRSPTLQSINNFSAQELPYTGLLCRGTSPIKSFADGLGFVWSHLGKNQVDFQAYDTFMSSATAPSYRLVKGLPPYVWDHEGEYWHESRYTRAQRLRASPVHQLLGHVMPDSTEQDIRWRNILQPTEIPWLKDHRLQGQVVFPAAGYITLALEAILQISKGAPISLIEVLDLELDKALTIDEDDASVEAIFSLNNFVRRDGKVLEANFTYNATEKGRDSLDIRATGRVRALLGEYLATALPPRSPQPPSLVRVCHEEFYASLEKMSYQYSGPFKVLTDLQRRLGYATGFILNYESTGMVVHPAILDAAFQSTFLAHSVPFDGGIWALHVPKTIRSVRINPALCASEVAKGTPLLFNSVQPVNSSRFEGDVDIYPASIANAMIQVQGLKVSSL